MRMSGWIKHAWLLALAGPAMLATSAMAAPPPGDYRIGFITENTGPIAFAGLSYWHGAQLAAEEISSSGGIAKGVTLSLADKESGSDPARAIQDMHQFIADRTIIATSCCILSPVAGSLKPIVNAAKMPLVIFGATSPTLAQPPYVCSMTILPGPKDAATAKHVAEVTKPKTAAYFIAADNDAFKARAAAAKQALEDLGVKTVATVNVLSADTDFTAPATQAMGAKPDLMLVYATETPTVGIVGALRQRQYGGVIVGNDVLSPEAVFRKMGPAAAKDVVFPISFSADLDKSPAATAFVAAYRKKFNAAPDIYSAQGYEVIHFIAQAMKSLDAKPTRESMAAALSKISTLDHDVYGGEKITNGQAETTGTLMVSWSADGKLEPWQPQQ